MFSKILGYIKTSSILFSFISLFAFGVAAECQTRTISGLILDDSSEEVLIGARVNSNGRHCLSNDYGFFSIPSLENQNATIEVSHIGYLPQTLLLFAPRDTFITIRLISNNYIDPVVVSARPESGIRSIHPGSTKLSTSQINGIPSLLGEKDIIKSFQILPGIQEGTGGFSGIYVRGGGTEENLMLIDGAEIYNASHILGVFSVFMPEAVKSATIYKGSFPAKYGGRASSVLDIRTIDGDAENYHGSLAVGLLSTKIHFEGPIYKERTSFQISGRLANTSFASPLIKHLQDESKRFNYYFYDLNAKITHRFGKRDKLFLSAYNGKDELSYSSHNISHDPSEKEGPSEHNSDTAINWGNNLVSAGWIHIFSGKLSSSTTLSFNRYKMKCDNHTDTRQDSIPALETHHFVFQSGIKDIGARTDFEFNADNRNTVLFGASYAFHTYTPETFSHRMTYKEGNYTDVDTTSKGTSPVLFGHETALYAQDEIRFSDRFSISPGMRLSFFFTGEKTHFSLQPRLSTIYSFSPGFFVKGSYSRMAQHVHLLTSSQMTLPMDLWVPITEKIKPLISDQYSIGIYNDYLKDWEFSFEGYYKSMQNVLEYRDGAAMIGQGAQWQNNVECGIGRSYGIEIFVHKLAGKTTGSIAYTLAKSERRFPDGSVNRGKWYPFKYDRRHSVNLSIQQKVGKNIELAAIWMFHTGGVISIPERQTAVLTPDGKLSQVDLVSKRGGYRLPASHRLNISLDWHIRRSRHESVLNLSVYNLYNAKCPDIIENNTFIRKLDNGNSIVTHKLKIYTLLPILPSIGYNYIF